MRAMPLAFPGNALVRDFETQFMCGDALLVAPILRDGGDVEIALPPGDWFDLNTRQRIAGRQVIRYRAKLDQFPVFGREGHALPLGRAVQHTGEIDAARPLEMLWVFGKPTRGVTDFAQAKHRSTATTACGRHGVKVEFFGDAAASRKRCRCDGDDGRPALAITVRGARGHRSRTRRDAGGTPRRHAVSGAPRRPRRPRAARRAGRTHRPGAALRRVRSRPHSRRRAAWSRSGTSRSPRRSPRAARIRPTRAAWSRCSRRDRRLRDRRVRGARHRADAEERHHGRGHRVLRPHRIPRRAHAHAARRDAAGRRREATRRCASRWPRRTWRWRTCRRRSRAPRCARRC